MKKLIAGLIGLAAVAALSTPALAANAGGTGHVTFDVQATISFTFTSQTAALGSLPGNGTFTAEHGISYTITASDPWTLTQTPGTIPNNVQVTVQSDGSPGCPTITPLVSNTATTGCAEVGGSAGVFRSGAAGSTPLLNDNFKAKNLGGALAGNYDVPIVYVATD